MKFYTSWKWSVLSEHFFCTSWKWGYLHHGLQEGACAIVRYLHPQDQCPSKPESLVKELSRAPGYVLAWKKSSLRRAAIRVLALARSYYPKVVEPALLTLGMPAEHEDGSPFSKEDFKAREIEVRPFAREIAAKMDPELWTHHYDAKNKRAVDVTPQAIDFGRPSKVNAGASTSARPSLSTASAPTPARVRPEDDGKSQPQEEASQRAKDSSIPQSSAQGTAANAPSSGKTPVQEENILAEKDHPLDDY